MVACIHQICCNDHPSSESCNLGKVLHEFTIREQLHVVWGCCCVVPAWQKFELSESAAVILENEGVRLVKFDWLDAAVSFYERISGIDFVAIWSTIKSLPVARGNWLARHRVYDFDLIAPLFPTIACDICGKVIVFQEDYGATRYIDGRYQYTICDDSRDSLCLAKAKELCEASRKELLGWMIDAEDKFRSVRKEVNRRLKASKSPKPASKRAGTSAS